MPLYDLDCPSCGDTEGFAPVADLRTAPDGHGHMMTCDCGEEARVALRSPHMLQGVIFCESPSQLGGGVEWYSNREKKAWMKENRAGECHADSKEWRLKMEESRDFVADRQAGRNRRVAKGRLKMKRAPHAA